jgi:F-type H+-transporting ATPase subunit delta
MTRLGRSYAQAFLNAALAGYDVEDFLERAGALLRALTDGPLRAFLLAPAVPLSAKRNVLDELAAKAGIDEFGRRLFRLILENRRIAHTAEVLSALREAYDRRRGVVEARVAVASPISEPERSRLAQALSRRVGKTVRMQVETNAEILGGFVARIGSEVFDASAVRAIERFAQEVKEGAKP